MIHVPYWRWILVHLKTLFKENSCMIFAIANIMKLPCYDSLQKFCKLPTDFSHCIRNYCIKFVYETRPFTIFWLNHRLLNNQELAKINICISDYVILNPLAAHTDCADAVCRKVSAESQGQSLSDVKSAPVYKVEIKIM